MEPPQHPRRRPDCHLRRPALRDRPISAQPAERRRHRHRLSFQRSPHDGRRSLGSRLHPRAHHATSLATSGTNRHPPLRHLRGLCRSRPALRWRTQRWDGGKRTASSSNRPHWNRALHGEPQLLRNNGNPAHRRPRLLERAPRRAKGRHRQRRIRAQVVRSRQSHRSDRQRRRRDLSDHRCRQEHQVAHAGRRDQAGSLPLARTKHRRRPVLQRKFAHRSAPTAILRTSRMQSAARSAPSIQPSPYTTSRP